MRRVAALIAGLSLAWIASPAHAENWVQAAEWVDIDADSIRRGSDGLVYYNAEDEFGFSMSAIDCQQRMFYVQVTEPDWKARGTSIKPGSDTEQELNFVCSRA